MLGGAVAHDHRFRQSVREDPGAIERRVIGYFFEVVKRICYDIASLRLGRDSESAVQFKNETRMLLRDVRKTCYGMVNEHLTELDGVRAELTAVEVIDIIRYVLPDDQVPRGMLYGKLAELTSATFGSREAPPVIKYMWGRITGYATTALARIREDYAGERSRAEEHMLPSLERRLIK